jgi:hypothetical protein
MARRYNDAFQLIESCVCDSILTPQATDLRRCHPSGRTCTQTRMRAGLKLFFVTYGCSGHHALPILMTGELLAYTTGCGRISSYCRLTPEEEMFYHDCGQG